MPMEMGGMNINDFCLLEYSGTCVYKMKVLGLPRVLTLFVKLERVSKSFHDFLELLFLFK